MDERILTGETDIYTYFEIIDKTEADSILDVGMFLKRIGSVSRQVKDKEIPAYKKLVGIDFFPEIKCPVWNTVYDDTYKPNDFFLSGNAQRYELAVVLQLEEHVRSEDVCILWKWLSTHVAYIFTDWRLAAISEMIEYRAVKEITVDDRTYGFIFTEVN